MYCGQTINVDFHYFLAIGYKYNCSFLSLVFKKFYDETIGHIYQVLRLCQAWHSVLSVA